MVGIKISFIIKSLGTLIKSEKENVAFNLAQREHYFEWFWLILARNLFYRKISLCLGKLLLNPQLVSDIFSLTMILFTSGGVSPAMKKMERYSVQKVTGDGRCLFRALVELVSLCSLCLFSEVSPFPLGNISRKENRTTGIHDIWASISTVHVQKQEKDVHIIGTTDLIYLILQIKVLQSLWHNV